MAAQSVVLSGDREKLVVELVDEGDHQLLRLPKGVRFGGNSLSLRLTDTGAVLEETQPKRRKRTREEIDAWFAKLDYYNRVAGPFMPEGRNQPPIQGRNFSCFD